MITLDWHREENTQSFMTIQSSYFPNKERDHKEIEWRSVLTINSVSSPTEEFELRSETDFTIFVLHAYREGDISFCFEIAAAELDLKAAIK